jgi:hypothetical protein
MELNIVTGVDLRLSFFTIIIGVNGRGPKYVSGRSKTCTKAAFMDRFKQNLAYRFDITLERFDEGNLCYITRGIKTHALKPVSGLSKPIY